MNIKPVDEYRKLMNLLLFLREAEGGQLSDEIESSYVERLDELWWSLSEVEQQEYEAGLAAGRPPGGPDELALVDCVVDAGATTGPRKAA
ncbi:MAG: hypothetical protein HYZ29_21140 [Myxococcales bacterium]|nr:hypothetical protein [Myxococcales bacterium]